MIKIHLFKKASEHIQNENIVNQINNDIELQKISEKIEPNTILKHARIIAQPLQRNSSVSEKILKNSSYFISYSSNCKKDIILPENNNTNVKLDPSILKYTNQQLPVAIVAPSKSNHNSLEKRKIHSDG